MSANDSIADVAFRCFKLRRVGDGRRDFRLWLSSRKGQSSLFGLAGLIIAAATIFADQHWLPIGIAVSTPWIALAINRASRGQLGFVRWTSRARYPLSYWDFTTLPTMALAVLAINRFLPIDADALILPTLVFGGFATAVFFSMVVWPPNKKHDPFVISLGAIGFLGYAFACLAILNGLLPQASPAQFETRIISKYILNGRNHPRMFVLEPWGPFDSGAIRVSLVMYDRLQPGQSICMLLHPGGLGLQWWEIAPSTSQNADPKCQRIAQK